jgi:hypothetical protein
MQFRCTALIRAAVEGYAEVVRLLVDSGANKEAQDSVRDISIFSFLERLHKNYCMSSIDFASVRSIGQPNIRILVQNVHHFILFISS